MTAVASKPSFAIFMAMVRAACAAAGYGRAYRKELTLWAPREEWEHDVFPSDDVVNRGADDLGWEHRKVWERWTGREVIEVYVSERVGPVTWNEWELCDNVEIDPVKREWSMTGLDEWRQLEVTT